MSATLQKAFGYQGDAMNLPVADIDAAVPFYETKLGFRAVSVNQVPPRSAILSRDQVEMRLVENGGDPTQDGCAFHVLGLDGLRAEFQRNGLPISNAKDEQHGDTTWKVFYVVAPDGLCYWFGEKQ
jgi:catechol 2,3-dioxygenase-like lactoylglutathione lyase family enzyme